MSKSEARSRPLRLFEAFGVEIEYMIVDREELDVRPIADELLRDESRAVVSDLEFEGIGWSNELALHVVELKTAAPTPVLDGAHRRFHESVREVNQRLGAMDARLLPGGAHPWMDPSRDTRLWPHDHNEIYALYDRVFDCRGHGWSNLQSTHLNLPFHGDEEFGRLHAGVRLLLPLLPALAASTPMLDGALTGRLDSRLHSYRHNQDRIPSLIGSVIPERAFDQQAYHELIFDPIVGAIRPHDTEGVLDRHFLNSRAAIARFDRGSIEIRVLDAQEAPRMDLGVVELVVAVLRDLAEERWSSVLEQQSWHETRLLPLLEATIESAEDAWVAAGDFLRAFGIRTGECTAGQVWARLAEGVGHRLSLDGGRAIEILLARGSLATRLTKALGELPDRQRAIEVYAALAESLADNEAFIPDQD